MLLVVNPSGEKYRGMVWEIPSMYPRGFVPAAEHTSLVGFLGVKSIDECLDR